MEKVFYINKLLEYLNNTYDRVDKLCETDEYIIFNVFMKIQYDTYFINKEIQKIVPTLSIDYHIPEIIITDNKTYNINTDNIPEHVSFITLRVYK